MTNLRRLQDIQLGNSTLINTYRNYFSTTQINEAHALINTNVLRSYVLQASWMNEAKNKIETLEEYSDIEIRQSLIAKDEEFQKNIDELSYIQEYNNIKQYYKNNFVSYNNDIYFCIQNSVGNLPTNTSYWLKIGLIGEKGQYGLGINYKGIWSASISYNKYDLVIYENNLYIALQNNSNNMPPSDLNRYLNNSLYLNNDLHLGIENSSTNTWFLLTKIKIQPIYVLPFDYTQLQPNSIFFAEV